jgi:hypothetical protein
MLNHFAVLKGVAAAGERREMVDALLQQTNSGTSARKDCPITPAA